MAQVSIDEKKLKMLLRETLAEVIEQKKDLFQKIVTDAIEDIAMTNAIKEGEFTEPVSKHEVFNILDGKL